MNNSIENNVNESEMVNLLNGFLSDNQIYYQNIRGLHWNIVGQQFLNLHVKLEELYTASALDVDEIAERVRMLGATPLHTFEDYIATAKLEVTKNVSEETEAIKVALANIEYLVSEAKTIFNKADENTDIGTTDLLSRYILEAEKNIWMLKASLKK